MRISQALPTATADRVASTTIPDTRVTLPATGSGSASASAAPSAREQL